MPHLFAVLRRVLDGIPKLGCDALHFDHENPMTYEIVNNGRAIKCLRCGKTSHNWNDIRYLFCAFCNQFHKRADDDIL
jgi:hypothetical protein